MLNTYLLVTKHVILRKHLGTMLTEYCAMFSMFSIRNKETFTLNKNIQNNGGGNMGTAVT